MPKSKRAKLGNAAKALRIPLRRRFIGFEQCERVYENGRVGGPLKLCVRGGKYGFIGELHPSTGSQRGVLLVPTGDARTPQQALINAQKFLVSVAVKRN